MRNSLRENFIGYKSNMLTVVEYGGKRANTDAHHWKCLCDCGNYCVVRGPKLTGKYKQISCGCASSRFHNGKKQRNPDTALNNHYQHYLKRSEKLNRQFLITKEEFRTIVSKNCYYCKLEPRPNSHSNRISHTVYLANTIDRIDSSIGYVLSNCRPCCWTCNQAKNTMSEKEFYEWINRVYSASIEFGRIEEKNVITNT